VDEIDLGLFLGASCFTLVDLVATMIEKFFEKKREKKDSLTDYKVDSPKIFK